jgi:hypothetical protein
MFARIIRNVVFLRLEKSRSIGVPNQIFRDTGTNMIHYYVQKFRAEFHPNRKTKVEGIVRSFTPPPPPGEALRRCPQNSRSLSKCRGHPPYRILYKLDEKCEKQENISYTPVCKLCLSM